MVETSPLRDRPFWVGVLRLDDGNCLAGVLSADGNDWHFSPFAVGTWMQVEGIAAFVHEQPEDAVCLITARQLAQAARLDHRWLTIAQVVEVAW